MTIRNQNRRRFISTLGAGLLGACSAPLIKSQSSQGSGSVGSGSAGTAINPQSLQCHARSQQTEGPYFVDTGLVRRDIRSDPKTGKISAGEPLTITIETSTLLGTQCTALPKALVDIWHCDAQGQYSDVADQNGFFNTKGQQFLRGQQITDAQGKAQFATIYPGWYEGRTVHIHFKIRWADAKNNNHSFTSQLYFDDALSDQVYQNKPYNTTKTRTTLNSRDGIYRQGGNDLTLKLTKDSAGYHANFTIGLLES